MTKKAYKATILLMTATVTAGSLISCGGNSKSAAQETGAYTSYENGAAFSMAGGGMADGGFYDDTADGAYVVEETAAAAPAAASDTAMEEEISMVQLSEETYANKSESRQQPASSRKLIRTVSLNVETTDFDNLLTTIQQSAATDGGYIEQSEISGTSISSGNTRKRFAFLMVRIPSAKLDGFLTQMSAKSNVMNRSENVQDVTLQYTDIESRKKSLTIEQERLWALLEKADTLEAVIALEERLSEIRYQLEGFESQLRTYDNQVDYSTVHISIQEVGVFTPTAPDSIGTRIQKGFVRNLERVATSLTDLLVWLISHLPALTVLAAIVAGARILVRKILRKKSGSGQGLDKPSLPKAFTGGASPKSDGQAPEDPS